MSIDAAKTIWEHLNSTVGAREILKINQTIQRVEVLEPHRENADWANAAIVVHMADGSRYGMEVCPFPVIPSSTLRSMTTEPETTPPEPDPADDPSTVQLPEEPPIPDQPPYTP